MPEHLPMDQLEQEIARLLARQGEDRVAARDDLDPAVAPLLAVARVLRDLPHPAFKARLKAELERSTSMATVATEPLAAVRQTATPTLRIRDAAAALEFYKAAFGARELMRFAAGGRIPHAELAIGNSVIIVADEALDYGFPSPASLGGSPVTVRLYVDDADVLVVRAVAAGAELVSPVIDQFYGDRSGDVVDPFGYRWTIATRKEDLSLDEMHRRLAALEKAQQKAEAPRAAGHQTVTPYLVVQDALAMVEFVTRVFGAEQRHQGIGSAGGLHTEVRIGDSTVMIGGGAPNLSWRGASQPAALHVYVEDTDAAFARALEAGATATHEPADMEYGERSAGVVDAAGNHWYIATAVGEPHVPEGMHTVTASLHPLRADPVISFLQRAFGARTLERHASPQGVVLHAKIKLGDSILEIGEAHGPFQPMRSMFLLQVPDVDAAYRRALAAGATSITEPGDQAYGMRNAAVEDAFGHQWYVATPIRQGS